MTVNCFRVREGRYNSRLVSGSYSCANTSFTFAQLQKVEQEVTSCSWPLKTRNWRCGGNNCIWYKRMESWTWGNSVWILLYSGCSCICVSCCNQIFVRWFRSLNANNLVFYSCTNHHRNLEAVGYRTHFFCREDRQAAHRGSSLRPRAICWVRQMHWCVHRNFYFSFSFLIDTVLFYLWTQGTKPWINRDCEPALLCPFPWWAWISVLWILLSDITLQVAQFFTHVLSLQGKFCADSRRSTATKTKVAFTLRHETSSFVQTSPVVLTVWKSCFVSCPAHCWLPWSCRSAVSQSVEVSGRLFQALTWEFDVLHPPLQIVWRIWTNFVGTWQLTQNFSRGRTNEALLSVHDGNNEVVFAPHESLLNIKRFLIPAWNLWKETLCKHHLSRSNQSDEQEMKTTGRMCNVHSR